MTLRETQDKLENDIKCELYQYCEEEKTLAEAKVKKEINLLLDYIDELIIERGNTYILHKIREVVDEVDR